MEVDYNKNIKNNKKGGGGKMERKELIKVVKAKYPLLSVKGIDNYELQEFLRVD